MSNYECYVKNSLRKDRNPFKTAFKKRIATLKTAFKKIGVPPKQPLTKRIGALKNSLRKDRNPFKTALNKKDSNP